MTNITSNQTSNNKLYWVADNIIADSFPPAESALRDPDGLLAIGGDLSAERLLDAYRRGIFPWYSQGQPVLWWSPDPRCILVPEEVYVSHSLRKVLRKKRYEITFNRAFNEVISKCAEPRKGNPDTWITDEIKDAYADLNRLGHILSVECWENKLLVGGLYGVVIGKIYFGESMFSHRSDASKVALVCLCNALVKNDFRLVDCQIFSRHLRSMGAKPVSRNLFLNMLGHYCSVPANNTWPD